MKTNKTNQQPAMNFLRPDGVQEQIDNRIITKVFLTNGERFNIVPGSFHIYVTSGDRPQPYVQFQASLWDENFDGELVHTIEIFPASVAGVGYLSVEEESEEVLEVDE